MTTSVKMRPEDKVALDRLQATLTSRTGHKMSQQELLRRLVRLGEERIADLTDEDAPPTPEEIEASKRRLRDLAIDTGIETSHEEIDRILYGGSE